jgi:hypothetical protein
MKRNPLLWIILGLVVIGVIGGGVWWMKSKQTAAAPAQTEKKKKVTAPINVIPEGERPYIAIAPTADGHNIVITVEELKKSATETEFELEYQAGSLLQGAFGSLKLDKTPAETKILLGSCSAGGACTYHEDVQGGTLLTKFSGPEAYALKSEWKYIENKTKETALSSKDGKFQISGTELGKQKLLVIFNSPGFPGDPKATVVSEHYTLAGIAELKGKAKVSIRAKEEGKLTIMGWNGQSWVSFPTTAAKDDAKMATAEVDLLSLYLVTKQ